MQATQTSCNVESLQNCWDELDCLIDQLRAMASLLQCASPSWIDSPPLIPYMQVMTDMLVQVDELHQAIREEMKCLEVTVSGNGADGASAGE